MKYYAKSLVWIGLVTLLKFQVANAAVHNISQGQLPICNNWNNSWSISGSTYTCNASVSFVAGDEYVANSPITLRADAGIILSGNKIGSVASPIALQTTYGTLKAIVGSSVIYGDLTTGSGTLVLAGVSLIGNVQTSGAVTIDSSTLSGTVNGSGQGVIRNSSVSGAVAFNNGLTGVNAVFSSTLTSTNGSVNLSGGSVAGLINVACCKVTISQGAVISKGIVAGSNGIDIRDSSVAGDLKAGNNPIVMVNVNMTSGTISPGNNSLTITGGAVTADVTNAHRVFISGNAVVTGDVLARYEVRVSDSTVVGDIATVMGHDGLHHVYLANSEIYGNVTVRDDWGTINGDARSKIYGVCTYKDVNPASLCGGGGIPPDPVLDECEPTLVVDSMVSGNSHFAYVSIQGPDECSAPKTLKFSFGYDNPSSPPERVALKIKYNGVEHEAEEGRKYSFYNMEFSEVNGKRQLKVDLEYFEAGRLILYVHDVQEERDPVSEKFVARPERFSIVAEGAKDCDPTQEDFIPSDCSKFVAAGEEFTLSIKALNALGEETKNFEYNSVQLSVVHDDPGSEVCAGGLNSCYPLGGRVPEIYPKSFQHKVYNANIFAGGEPYVNEVGIIKIRAVAENYLSTGEDVSGISNFIARFVPDYLKVSGSASMDSCDGITYQREKVGYLDEPHLKVEAFGRKGEVYNYYYEGFWRLPTPQGEFWTQFGDRKLPLKTDADSDGLLEIDSDGSVELIDELEVVEERHFVSGRTFVWKGNGWTYDSGKLSPEKDDLPFSVERRFPAYDEAQPSLTDLDDVCSRVDGENSCLSADGYYSLKYTNSGIRFGRLRVGNAHGSELQDLDVPWVIESWQGSADAASFQKELLDSCSAKRESSPNDLGEPELDQALGLLHMPINKLLDAQSGAVNLTAPKTPGSVLVRFPQLEEWLHYDWNGDGERELPTGLATFGIYQGPKPLIFRRELYRGMQ